MRMYMWMCDDECSIYIISVMDQCIWVKVVVLYVAVVQFWRWVIWVCLCVVVDGNEWSRMTIDMWYAGSDRLKSPVNIRQVIASIYTYLYWSQSKRALQFVRLTTRMPNHRSSIIIGDIWIATTWCAQNHCASSLQFWTHSGNRKYEYWPGVFANNYMPSKWN